MKKLVMALVAASLVASFAGCANLPSSMASLPVIGTPQGSGTAGATTTGKTMASQTCAQPMGTVTVDEDTSQSWYSVLTGQYQLPSLIPVIRLLIQQSNCFVIVDRQAGLQQSMQERQMAQAGLLRSNSNFGAHQVVAADYTIEPSVNFTNNSMAGIAGLVGSFIPEAGMLAANVNMKEAQASLTMVDNRSSVQVAAATGTGKGFDFAGFDSGSLGHNKYGSLGAYASTAQGKVVLAAFIDAYGNLVQSVRQYKAQHVAGGLGAGGQLAVQDSGSASTGAMQQTGMSVHAMQMALNSLGYPVGRADGVLGPHTRAELRRFQSAAGLRATGQLDGATIAALRQRDGSAR